MSNSLDQALGALVESNHQIAKAVDKIEENLKVLNDHNILHHEQSVAAHAGLQTGQTRLMEKITVMTSKYWWVIVALIAAVLILAGVKEAARFLLGGV